MDGIVLRAIHPNPSRRFQTALEFIDALKPFIHAGYDGVKELAHQVFRYESALKKDALANEVARARPLLEPTTTTIKSAKKRRALPFVLLVAATVAAVGICLVPRPERGKPATVGPTTDPPTTEPPAPPPVSPPSLPPPPPVAPPAKPPAPPSPVPTVVPPPQPAPKVPTHLPKASRESAPTAESASQPGPEALMTAARESFDAENFPAALKLARAAAQQGAGAKAYLLVGTCLSLAKDYDGARTAFEHALALAPENAEAKRLLEQLQRKSPNKTP
jgi:tetratricopeptide (TPR) repeat protein